MFDVEHPLLFTMADVRAATEARTFARGERCAASNRVTDLRITHDGQTISARVRGTAAVPYGVIMLTGKTKQRERVVKRFEQREVPLFLISLEAGGTGLNLTAADTVVHDDPWRNPAVERQATGRAQSHWAEATRLRVQVHRRRNRRGQDRRTSGRPTIRSLRRK